MNRTQNEFIKYDIYGKAAGNSNVFSLHMKEPTVYFAFQFFYSVETKDCFHFLSLVLGALSEEVFNNLDGLFL